MCVSSHLAGNYFQKEGERRNIENKKDASFGFVNNEKAAVNVFFSADAYTYALILDFSKLGDDLNVNTQLQKGVEFFFPHRLTFVAM